MPVSKSLKYGFKHAVRQTTRPFVGWKLCKLFPSCLNVIIPENGSKEGKVLKILVEVELDKPLLRGTKIKLGEEHEWAAFKYKNLPSFCFYSGRIGHIKKVVYGNWLTIRDKVFWRINLGLGCEQLGLGK